MQINLNNRNALVCGSTQGIGKASAIALAAAGARVTLVARNAESLQNVASELPNSDLNHQWIAADFSDPNSLQSKVAESCQSFGAYHILVNNTGGPPGGEIVNADIEEFERAFTQHLKCNHLLLTTLIPGMKSAGFGRVVNIISTSVKQPLDGLGVSNTIRGAVASWSKTMANELGSFGITVNNVLPGATATVRLESIIQAKSEKTGRSIAEIEDAMKSGIPARRFASADEIAAAVTFLCSEQAGYVNGINLPVDGGRTKCL